MSRFIPKAQGTKKTTVRETIAYQNRILSRISQPQAQGQTVRLPPIGKKTQSRKEDPPVTPPRIPFSGERPSDSDWKYYEINSWEWGRPRKNKIDHFKNAREKLEYLQKQKEEANKSEEFAFNYMRPTETYKTWAAEEVKFPYKPKGRQPKQQPSCRVVPPRKECKRVEKPKPQASKNSNVVPLPPLVEPARPPLARFRKHQYVEDWINRETRSPNSPSRRPFMCSMVEADEDPMDWIKWQDFKSRGLTPSKFERACLKMDTKEWQKRKFKEHAIEFTQSFLLMRGLRNCINLKELSNMLLSIMTNYQEATQTSMEAAARFLDECLAPIGVELNFVRAESSLFIAVRAKDEAELEKFKKQTEYKFCNGFIIIQRKLLRNGMWLDADYEVSSESSTEESEREYEDDYGSLSETEYNFVPEYEDSYGEEEVSARSAMLKHK